MSSPYLYHQFLNTSVDPRTGQFVLNIPFNYLFANHLKTQLDLNLSYSPMDERNMGFGQGWLFNLSRYNPQTELFFLSNGQTLQKKMSGQPQNNAEILLTNNKRRQVCIYKKSNGYWIYYKSGKIEVLNNQGKMVMITDVFGQSLTLNYCPVNAERLLSIIDKANTFSLTFNYDDSLSHISMTVASNNKWYTSKFNLDAANNRLSEYTLADNSATFSFGYNQQFNKPNSRERLYLIQWVHYPHQSRTQKILYDVITTGRANQRHYLPFVSKTRLFGGSIEQTVQYNLKTGSTPEHNFTLYNPNDITEQNYQYITQEIHPDKTIERTYDKFHLLIQESIKDGQQRLRKKIHYTYSCEYNQDFEDQIASYSFPTKITEFFYVDGRTTRTLAKELSYDEQGNLIEEIMPDRSRTVYQYYPANAVNNSNVERCPANPHGFIANLHYKADFTYPEQQAYTKVHSFTYKNLQRNQGIDEAPLVLDEEHSNSGYSIKYDYHNAQRRHDYQTLSKKTITYNRTNHRKIETYSMALNHAVNNERGVKYTTDIELYTPNNQRIYFETQTEVKSNIHGLVLYQSDSEDIRKTSQMTYDKLQRLLSIITEPNSDHETTTTYEYHDARRYSEIIEGSTSKKAIQYDSFGHEIEYFLADANNVYRKILERQYNTTGQLIKETENDFDGSTQLCSTSMTYTYDAWGEVAAQTDHLGNIHSINYVPEYNFIEEQSGDSWRTKTTFNWHNQPIDVSIFDNNGQCLLTQKFTYHLEGVVASEKTIDHKTNESIMYSHHYDDALRLDKTEDSDGNQTHYNYAKHTLETLIEKIQHNNKTIEHRTFDGYNRVTEEKVGREVTTYSYQGHCRAPTSVQQANGATLSYINDDRLQKPTKITSNDGTIDNHYEYCSDTGLIASEFNAFPLRRYQNFVYDNSGRMLQEKYHDVRNNNGSTDSQVTKEYRYSLLGKLLSFQNDLGDTETYSYDRYGRVVGIEHPHYSITKKWNNQNQMEEELLEEKVANTKTRNFYQYDAYGRENVHIHLIFDSAQSSYQQVKVYKKYNHHDQLTSYKELTDNRFIVEEKFAYDIQQRLITYEASGNELPQDGYQLKITKQTFTYDSLNNIKRVYTKFQNSQNDNISTYTYSDDNPNQLIQISHTHPSYPTQETLTYDENGQLIQDNYQTYRYDAFNRLSNITTLNGSQQSDYYYDSQGQLIAQETASQPLLKFHYHHGQLIGQSQGSKKNIWIKSDTKNLGILKFSNNQATGGSIFNTDQTGSIRYQTKINNVSQINSRVYTPYGEHKT